MDVSWSLANIDRTTRDDVSAPTTRQETEDPSLSNRRRRHQPREPRSAFEAAARSIANERLAERVQPTGNADPRRLGGAIVGPGGPHDRGAVVLDTTDCVLLDGTYACTVDGVRDGRSDGQMIYLTLSGRVNKTQDRVQVGYLFGPDGAAALITELLALADRHGTDLLDDVTRRLTKLHQDKNVDLRWLRAAIDNVIDNMEEAL